MFNSYLSWGHKFYEEIVDTIEVVAKLEVMKVELSNYTQLTSN